MSSARCRLSPLSLATIEAANAPTAVSPRAQRDQFRKRGTANMKPSSTASGAPTTTAWMTSGCSGKPPIESNTWTSGGLRART